MQKRIPKAPTSNRIPTLDNFLLIIATFLTISEDAEASSFNPGYLHSTDKPNAIDFINSLKFLH